MAVDNFSYNGVEDKHRPNSSRSLLMGRPFRAHGDGFMQQSLLIDRDIVGKT